MDAQYLAKRKPAPQTLADICERRPALASVLTIFIPLYTAREELRESLQPLVSPLPELSEPNAEFLANGVPLLANAGFDWIDAAFKKAAHDILPQLEAVEGLREDLKTFAEGLEKGTLIPSKLTQTYLSSDAKTLATMLKNHAQSTAVGAFLTQQILGPVLQAARMKSVEPDLQTWRQGYCPVCGSFPSVGCLSRPDPDQSEFLKGGGGHKYLHCSLCGHDWRFRRGACPGCSNEDPGAIEYMRAKESPWERVELCRKCNTYVGALDLRETTESPDLDAAAIGLMHLDLLAAAEGLRPLAPSLWNTFD